jgi:hypothetical protein
VSETGRVAAGLLGLTIEYKCQHHAEPEAGEWLQLA